MRSLPTRIPAASWWARAVVESTLTSDKSVLPVRSASAIRPCSRAEDVGVPPDSKAPVAGGPGAELGTPAPGTRSTTRTVTTSTTAPSASTRRSVSTDSPPSQVGSGRDSAWCAPIRALPMPQRKRGSPNTVPGSRESDAPAGGRPQTARGPGTRAPGAWLCHFADSPAQRPAGRGVTPSSRRVRRDRCAGRGVSLSRRLLVLVIHTPSFTGTGAVSSSTAISSAWLRGAGWCPSRATYCASARTPRSAGFTP